MLFKLVHSMLGGWGNVSTEFRRQQIVDDVFPFVGQREDAGWSLSNSRIVFATNVDQDPIQQDSGNLESKAEPETLTEETSWFSEAVESIVDADRNLVSLWESMDVEYARESIADQIADAQPGTTAGSITPEEIDAVADEIGLMLEECTEIIRADNGRQVATDGGVMSE